MKKLPPGIHGLKIRFSVSVKKKFVSQVNPSVQATRKCDHQETSTNSKDIGHHQHGEAEKDCKRKYV